MLDLLTLTVLVAFIRDTETPGRDCRGVAVKLSSEFKTNQGSCSLLVFSVCSGVCWCDKQAAGCY